MSVAETAPIPMIEEAAAKLIVIEEAEAIVRDTYTRMQTEEGTRIQDQLGTEGKSVHDSGIVDANVGGKLPAPTPSAVESALPVEQDSKMARTTLLARTAIGEILHGKDDRLIVITGPCSIHNAEEALAYAKQVANWREQYGDRLEIIMRAYFEKPRSETGWKGLTYDPRLDSSDNVALGLVLTRMLAREITAMGVPIAAERLNALTPQYLDGLVAYDAIGARNVTDQKAREYASATSSPVGLKNGPDGSIEDAVSAMVAARQKHTFLGMDKQGRVSVVQSRGNTLGHLILRGGKSGPNYQPRFIRKAKAILAAKRGKTGEDLPEAIIVDASHGNSRKQAANQHTVIRSIARQVAAGEAALKGVMLESNLVAGSQPIGDGKNLEYGRSVTDECINLADTALALGMLANSVVARRKKQADPALAS